MARISHRYLPELRAARQRLAAQHAPVVSTPYGPSSTPIGTGPPVLAIHGVMGGWSNTWCLFHPSPVARKAPEPARRARPPSREDELRRGGVLEFSWAFVLRPISGTEPDCSCELGTTSPPWTRALFEVPVGLADVYEGMGPVGYSGNACTPRALPVR
jgi:hypothetical protein